MIRECCVCGRIEVEGNWTWNSLSGEDRRGVTHVYCPHCFDGMMHKVDRFFLRKTYIEVYALAEAGRL